VQSESLAQDLSSDFVSKHPADFIANSNALIQRCQEAGIAIVRVFHTDGEALSTNPFAIESGVAQTMVAFTRRGPLDAEQSPLLKYRDHLHPAIHRVQDAVCADPKANWTSADMAKIGFLTEQHLLRLFTEHVGLTPRDFVQNVRCAIAQHALSKGLPATKAAELSGLQTARRLRDTLARQR
jgi:AraC-like DNA-binding protein